MKSVNKSIYRNTHSTKYNLSQSVRSQIYDVEDGLYIDLLDVLIVITVNTEIDVSSSSENEKYDTKNA